MTWEAVGGKWVWVEKGTKTEVRAVPIPIPTEKERLKKEVITAKEPVPGQIIISEDELEALRVSGWRIKDSGYSTRYSTYWDNWYIIREFIQNALDERDEAGIGESPTIQFIGNTLTISDKGRGLGALALYTETTKAAAKDLRGEFGEGLKKATLAALRAGYSMEIVSSKKMIRPYLVKIIEEGTEIQELYFTYKDNPQAVIGTTVKIKGYNGDLYTDRFIELARTGFEPLLGYSEKVGRFNRSTFVYETKYPNRLYVKGIYVRELHKEKKSRFSYDIWGLALNPDRTAERNLYDFNIYMSYLWANAPAKYTELAIIFLKEANNPESFESILQISNSEKFKEYKEGWTQAWEKVFGSKAILRTDDVYTKMAEGYGYKVVRLVNSSLENVFKVNQIAPTDKSVLQKEDINFDKNIIPIPDYQLEPQSLFHIQFLRKINLWLSEERFPGAKDVGVRAAKLPVSGAGQGTAGLAEYAANRIDISPEKFYHFEWALDVYIHEMGHIFSKAPDETRAHMDGVTRIATYIAALFQKHAHVVAFKELVW